VPLSPLAYYYNARKAQENLSYHPMTQQKWDFC
jgi:hypothetical protein